MPPTPNNDGIDHLAPHHQLCPDCPFSRKVQEKVGKPIGYLLLAAGALWVLWYSPAIYHTSGQLTATYSQCVDARPDATNIAEFYDNRSICMRLARDFRPVPRVAVAQTRPARPADDMRASPGRPGFSVDSRSGCWVWNQNPQPNEAVIWSGGCGADGRAGGHGTVEWRWDDKIERFEGTLREGKGHGRGIYISFFGSRYEGEFQDGTRTGRGVYTFANGNRYEGEFRGGLFDGRGVYTSANGTRYEGEFRDGKAQGPGVLKMSSGSIYNATATNGCVRHAGGVMRLGATEAECS